VASGSSVGLASVGSSLRCRSGVRPALLGHRIARSTYPWSSACPREQEVVRPHPGETQGVGFRCERGPRRFGPRARV